MMQPPDPTPENSVGSIQRCSQWCPGWMSFATLPGSLVHIPDSLSAVDSVSGNDLYSFLASPPPFHPPIC